MLNRKLKEKTMSQNQPPVARFRNQGLTVNVWERVTEKGTFYDVSYARSYKDQAGDWHNASNCPASEIQTLRKLLDLAHIEILGLKAEE
jgi:hypothetical protein